MRPCMLAVNIAVGQQCVRLAGYAYLPSWNGAAVFASLWLSRRVHASGLLLPMLALATDALGPTARLATEGRAMRQANSWLVADFMCACVGRSRVGRLLLRQSSGDEFDETA